MPDGPFDRGGSARLPVVRFAAALVRTGVALALTAWCLTGAATAQAVDFFDGTFDPADWSDSSYLVYPFTGTHTVSQVLTGGNPDAYRSTTMTAPVAGESSGVIQLTGNAVYDPAMYGAIDTIDFSLDIRFLGGSAGTSSHNQRLIIEQAGNIYLSGPASWASFGPGNGQPGNSWETRTALGMTATDFGLLIGSVPVPDFSPTGAPLTFGYFNDLTALLADNVTSIGGVDNFDLTVHPVIPPDTTPTADAGLDQTVDEGDAVQLDGTGSGDPNGDPLTYTWTQIAGTPVTLDDPTASQPTFSAPYIGANETLTFELVVDDGTEASVPDAVDVTVVDVNSPPVADAGDDSTIKEGATATLDGGNSFDPEGDAPLTYSWTQTAGPAVSLQPNASVASPVFAAPLGVGTVLTFELAVGDGKETGASDSVNVTVVENSAPTADAGSDQTVDEGSLVGLDGLASSDPDGGDTLSFAWTQVAGTVVVLSDPTSVAPTFDAPGVSAGGENLVFELVVSDDDPVNPKSSPPDSVMVTVFDVNDPPVCDLGRSSCPSSKLDKGDGCLLWPPNHKMVSVGIVGVTDPNDDEVTIEITSITQDEPVNGQGDGDSSPDAVIQIGTTADEVLLRSERTGLGGAQENGRVYVVGFTADDGISTCGGSVTVGVPHDRKDDPVDDGQFFDSTLP